MLLEDVCDEDIIVEVERHRQRIVDEFAGYTRWNDIFASGAWRWGFAMGDSFIKVLGREALEETPEMNLEEYLIAEALRDIVWPPFKIPQMRLIRHMLFGEILVVEFLDMNGSLTETENWWFQGGDELVADFERAFGLSDLHVGNIYVADDGTVYITDLGSSILGTEGVIQRAKTLASRG